MPTPKTRLGRDEGVSFQRQGGRRVTDEIVSTFKRRVFIKFKYLALVNQISASIKSFIVELKVVLTNRVDLFEKTDPLAVHNHTSVFSNFLKIGKASEWFLKVGSNLQLSRQRGILVREVKSLGN